MTRQLYMSRTQYQFCDKTVVYVTDTASISRTEYQFCDKTTDYGNNYNNIPNFLIYLLCSDSCSIPTKCRLPGSQPTLCVCHTDRQFSTAINYRMKCKRPQLPKYSADASSLFWVITLMKTQLMAARSRR